MYPIHTIKYPQTSPAVPPFNRPKKLVLITHQYHNEHIQLRSSYISAISQVLIKVQAKPSVEMKRKLRYARCQWFDINTSKHINLRTFKTCVRPNIRMSCSSLFVPPSWERFCISKLSLASTELLSAIWFLMVSWSMMKINDV
jgi:hypothetical protein